MTLLVRLEWPHRWPMRPTCMNQSGFDAESHGPRSAGLHSPTDDSTDEPYARDSTEGENTT
jgi:hypothetical protein